MALIARDPTGGEYNLVEQGLQDRILSIYGNAEQDEDYFRPDLADKHKVGFFSLDRCSQTDLTEIVDLKEMTEVLQILLQDVAALRRDINFTKHVMQADYESKLREKSLELYCRINERVTELEKMHEERVGTVRRAFRQQLSDAIARVAVLYNKNLKRKMKNEQSKHEGDAGELEQKYRELQITVRQNESVIHMLKMQIQQLQKEPSIAGSPSVSDRPSVVSPQTPSIESTQIESAPTSAPLIRPVSIQHVAVQVNIKPTTKSKHVQVDDSVSSKSPSINQEAEILRDEVDALSKKMEGLEDSLQTKDDENSKLESDVSQLNDDLMREKELVQQMKMENNQIRATMEQGKASSQQMTAGLQKQREEMERMMEERMRMAKEETSKVADAERRAKEQAEKDKIKLLMEQKKQLEEQLSRDRSKSSEQTRGDSDNEKMRRNEQMLKDEINRLKREIERIHKTWEKKFAILQQSLHALKDESYLRQTLQRQAAALHHASVSYSADTPLGIMASSKHTSPTKRPLPDIQKLGHKVMPSPAGGLPEKDYISYTVSAPSGRGTAMFSVEENQVMSENDREDLPADVVPLPPKPHRKSPPRCADDDRPPPQGQAFPPQVKAQ